MQEVKSIQDIAQLTSGSQKMNNILLIQHAQIIEQATYCSSDMQEQGDKQNTSNPTCRNSKT